ncbi:MAG: UDP-N-acetylglucosamine 1-carboxyvinyltransferase [Planctomycetota bacterium]|jgi:UDP-N-acetylglucosamine 1-carboxyvinyltransferase
MDKLVIEGGVPLRGRVSVAGAKNAALPLLAATLLCEGESRISGVPDLRDIRTMLRLLTVLGCEVEREPDGTLRIAVRDEAPFEAPYDIVKEMRASFSVLGPLLARRGRASVSMPGGCNLGLRPVDLHLKGFRAMGARIDFDQGYVRAKGPLRGEEIFLAGPFGPTVLGTANVMSAAVLTEGRTVIEGAACEPEIGDLAAFLNACGAKIEGVGSPRLVIDGVESLQGVSWRVIPDRMEAGTIMAAAAATGGDVTLDGADPRHMGAVAEALRGLGAGVEKLDGGIRVFGPERPQPLDLTTLPYPGFPTDLQAPFAAVLVRAQGMSVVTEKIYPERFMHVAELMRMGATIRKQGPSTIIQGVERLSGTEVMASDIRGGASLIVAALCAEGTTSVHRVYHVDRGYERIEKKLTSLGARIERMAE